MENPNAIKSISVYPVEIPYVPLGSRWLGRKKPDHIDSTIVIIETRSGLTGIGESCPIRAIYLPAFAAGLRAALAEMAPALLGQDATQINHIYQLMNESLFGHAYAKAAIDIACWDLLGKHCAQPVSVMLGGRFQNKLPVYASIPLRGIEEMVATFKQKQAQGYTRFQIKVGDDPIVDCQRVKAVVAAGRPGDLFMADANRGWSKADALRAVAELNEIDCYLEQPCATYDECLTVRERCNRPFILDEVIDSPADLARAIAEDALDALAIKVTHAGGLTPSKIERDICLAHGIKMRLEDTAGTEVTRATQAHLAAATPINLQLGCYSFINDRPAIADGAPEVRDGMMYLNNEPGLGLTPKMDVLGEPVAVYR